VHVAESQEETTFVRDGDGPFATALRARGIPFEPLMGVEAHFDVEKIAWLGNANQETNVCMVWHTSPVISVELTAPSDTLA